MGSKFGACWKHVDASAETGREFTIEVKRWGYTELLHIVAESKYMALIRARELRPNCECSLPEKLRESSQAV